MTWLRVDPAAEVLRLARKAIGCARRHVGDAKRAIDVASARRRLRRARR